MSAYKLGLACALVAVSAWAKPPCYPTPQLAYQQLMAEEKQRKNTKININTASIDQLIALDGVGHSTAAAIIAHRQQKGKFHSVGELAQVKGIGRATIDKNRHRLQVLD